MCGGHLTIQCNKSMIGWIVAESDDEVGTRWTEVIHGFDRQDDGELA